MPLACKNFNTKNTRRNRHKGHKEEHKDKYLRYLKKIKRFRKAYIQLLFKNLNMSLDNITEKIAGDIIHISLGVHKTLGPGLLESAYKECLYYEIKAKGFKVEKEKPIPLVYHSINLDCGYRADMVVEDRILLELKAVEELTKIHLAQMLTYMRVGGYSLGFIMNFNVLLFKDGIKRVVL